MSKYLNKDVCSILKRAENEMLSLHHPYVGSEHLLLSLLKNDNISRICADFDLTYDSFKNELIRIMGRATKASSVILYTPLLKMIIDKANDNSNHEHNENDEYYLFSSLLDSSDGIALRIIDNMGIDTKEISSKISKPKLISSLGINLNNSVLNEAFNREEEIKEIELILMRKNKNNPILVGYPGVGKSAIVAELARRIKIGEVPEKLKNKEIYMINTSSLIAGTKYRGEFEEKLNNLVKEVIDNPNIILFIDEIHTIMKTGSSEGSIDAANILKPYLANGSIKVIGATTINEYNEYIKKDMALARRFSKVIIKQPNKDDMFEILKKCKKSYELYYGLKINNEALKFLINVCERALPNMYNPDKCLEVLDNTCSKKIMNSNNIIVSKDDICICVNKLTNHVDLKVVDEIEKDLINNYNESQVKTISKILKSDVNKYVVLDGSEIKQKMKIIDDFKIRLGYDSLIIDCKDYNDEYSISKLINNNYLFNKIVDMQSGFLIFNNFNCASRIVKNIINIMTNKGYIENNTNERFYLDNLMIFILNNEDKQLIGFNCV